MNFSFPLHFPRHDFFPFFLTVWPCDLLCYFFFLPPLLLMLRVGRENAWPVKCMFLKCFHVINHVLLLYIILFKILSLTSMPVHSSIFFPCRENLISLCFMLVHMLTSWNTRLIFFCWHSKKWFSYHTFINYLIWFFPPAYLCVNKMLLLVHLVFSLTKMANNFEMYKKHF